MTDLFPLLERLMELYNAFSKQERERTGGGERERGLPGDSVPVTQVLAIDVLALFSVMKLDLWRAYMASKTEEQQATFLRTLLQTFQRIQADGFPKSWPTVQVAAMQLILNVLGWVRSLLDEYAQLGSLAWQGEVTCAVLIRGPAHVLFVPEPRRRFMSAEAFREELWLGYLRVILGVLRSPLLQIEQIPAWEARIVMQWSGKDMRQQAAELLVETWCVAYRLASLVLGARAPRLTLGPLLDVARRRRRSRKKLGAQLTRLRGRLVPQILQTTMLLHPEIRNVGMDLLYDLLRLEYQQTKSY